MQTIQLPHQAAIEAAAAQLTAAAAASGNVKRQIALNKGLYDLLLGAQLIAVAGGFLLPSSSRPGLVHRFDNATGTCDCEAGRHGSLCRHVAAVEIVEQAAQRVMPDLTDRAAKLERAREAAALLNECF